ncbi:MAG TPA: hypothetical protein VL294_07240 [Pseudolysinimonas sp.]|jgi:hypothetical protein|nr:hypothetical protein [Pseudolysinimonas sp.]
MTEKNSDDRNRDEVADALRARQSLENEAHGDENFSVLGLAGGERLQGVDDPDDDDQDAWDDDIQQSDDDEE